MNDWKKILGQLPAEQLQEQKMHTTEIRIKAKRKNTILGISPALFWINISVFLLVVILSTFWIITVSKQVRDYDRIYPGVSALGIDLGGMTISEAVDAIDEYSDNYYSGKQIILNYQDKTATINARNAIISVKSEQVAQNAYEFGREENLFEKHKLIKSTKKVEIPVITDQSSNIKYIEEVVDCFIEQVNQEYRFYSVVYLSESLEITRGQDGITVRREELLNKVKKMLSEGDFRTLVVEPDIEEALEPDVDYIRTAIYVSPTDAKLIKTGKKTYKIQEERLGKDIDIDQIRADFEDDSWSVRSYPYINIEPITAEKYKSLLFRDTLATYKTYLNPDAENRTTNVRLATEAINGVVLMPKTDQEAGEVFSFNAIVGERTVAKGYKPAPIFAAGEVVDGVGGGICQITSTLYVTTLYADLKVVERAPHAFAVSYVPKSWDATVQYGYIDYKFENDTKYPLKIIAELNGNTLSISFVGTNENPGKTVELKSEVLNEVPFDTEYSRNEALAPGMSLETQRGQNGYRCELYQSIYENGAEVERRRVNVTTYSPQTRRVEHG